MRYNPKEIEPKWQQVWQDNKTYQADLDSDKPKYIGMSMFNYPSGAGIHIGHALNYTISDVIARAKRQQGYESYHPVGWDSFGMPAENYAIKAGISPQQSMSQIIPSYHKQYQAMGWSNDWSKEIAAHHPDYYKWTQWLFAEVYRAGLAYQDARQQWWCNGCQTVLANEQVIEGKCWRHDSADDPLVAKREIPQWFFRITDYADEMLAATAELDWTSSVKTAQTNWIGKSEGAEIAFAVEGLQAECESLKVFTTAHDTIYGATFMVLAPEHPLVQRFSQQADNAVDIQDYVSAALRKSDIQRQASKHKSGVQIEGLYALHPITKEPLPIWVAEYVLIGYGTGAIMSVPGGDARDNEFAKKYDLPIILTTDADDFVDYSEDVKQDMGAYKLKNSAEFDGLSYQEARPKILDKLVSLGAAEAVTNYKIRDWSVSRQRYWGAPIPIIHCKGCGPVLVPDDQLPVVLPELEDFAPSGDGRSALARAIDWLKADCPTCGDPAERETDTLDTYICSSWYMLRYTDPHNGKQIFDSTRANKWMAIDFYNGADHATAHLIYARFITRFLHKQGLLDNPEPFTKFLYNGKVTAQDGTMFSKSKGNGVDPLDIIKDGYGADALRTYLMFASPLDLWTRWDPQGVPGSYRFLNRLWTLVQEHLEAGQGTVEPNAQLSKTLHRTIKKVTEDIDGLKYNTAISALMAAVNDLYKVKEIDNYQAGNWRSTLEGLVQLVAPFAPHTAEELWQQMGREDSVNVDNWPTLDESQLVEDTVTIGVQINGKVRAELQLAVDAPEAYALAAAKDLDGVKRHLEGKTIRKEIYIPGRILNIVAGTSEVAASGDPSLKAD